MELPCVTVIIPVRNEQYYISSCLARLFQQDYPRDRLEVIVADGMSTDRTREIAESFQGKGIALKVLLNPGLGRSHGLNLAIRAAKGDVIARIDARTVIAKDYLSRCVRTLLETGADNVGGIQKAIANTVTQDAIGLAMSHFFGAGNAQFRVGKKSGFVDTVYLGCFRREVFEKVGLFDEETPVISEDSDINYRIRKAGGRVYLNADIVVGYYPRETFRDLCKLYFRYGGARAGFLLKHKTFTSWRQLVPPIFILIVASLTVLSLMSIWSRVALIALLNIYIMTDLLVSAYLTLMKKRSSLFGPLLLAFPCMHFAWSFGFFRRLTQRPKPGSYWSY